MLLTEHENKHNLFRYKLFNSVLRTLLKLKVIPYSRYVVEDIKVYRKVFTYEDP